MAPRPGYLLLEDGERFDGELCAADSPALGEVVFTTGMSGYQESMTDPSFAGQLITFTYPHIGNYGASSQAMESERVWARAAIMREAGNREDAPSAERGWLDWLADCGIPAISGLDTRSLVQHIRRAGAMRGGLFAGSLPESRARELIEAEPQMAGQDLASVVSPEQVTRHGDGDGPHIAVLDTGIKASMVRELVARGARVSLHPCASSAAELLAEDPDAVFLVQRPRRPLRAAADRADGARADRQQAGVGDLPRPPAAVPRGRAGDLQAALRPPRRQPPGSRPAHRARGDHLPEPRLRRPRARRQRTIETDEPVRWETDFGVAELTHVNLYDRTVEGLELLDVPGGRGPVPPRGGPRAPRQPVPVRPLPDAHRGGGGGGA